MPPCWLALDAGNAIEAGRVPAGARTGDTLFFEDRNLGGILTNNDLNCRLVFYFFQRSDLGLE